MDPDGPEPASLEPATRELPRPEPAHDQVGLQPGQGRVHRSVQLISELPRVEQKGARGQSSPSDGLEGGNHRQIDPVPVRLEQQRSEREPEKRDLHPRMVPQKSCY